MIQLNKSSLLKSGVKMIAAGAMVIILNTANPATAKTIALNGSRTFTERLIVRIDGNLNAQRLKSLHSIGAVITRDLPIIHSVALTLPTHSEPALESLGFVRHISVDSLVEKSDVFTCDKSMATAAVNATGLTGKGVTVAVIDSGIVDDGDLGTNLCSATRIVQPGASRIIASTYYEGSSATDTVGHGSHVAGIIAGDGYRSYVPGFSIITYKGIATQANILNVRVLSDNGTGSVSDVVAALQTCVANKSKYNIRVINLSLGQPVSQSYLTDPLCQAAEAAWKAGIVVVCAAGNDGRASTTQTASATNEGWGTQYGSIQSPGDDPYVITVGATKQEDSNRSHDLIATYSSRGPTVIDHILKPDIIAPGNQVVSIENAGSYLSNTYATTNNVPMNEYTTYPDPGNSKFYFILSGTSMSAPVVSGAVALMIQQNPALTPDTIKARLMMSADKWTDPKGNFDPCTYGAGYLNIQSALKSTFVALSPALSPSLVKDTAGNVHISTLTVGTISLIWGNLTNLSSVWGANAVWNGNTIASSNVLWGTNVIWGSKGVKISSSDSVDLTATALNGER